jgi:hypothetical protein
MHATGTWNSQAARSLLAFPQSAACVRTHLGCGGGADGQQACSHTLQTARHPCQSPAFFDRDIEHCENKLIVTQEWLLCCVGSTAEFFGACMREGTLQAQGRSHTALPRPGALLGKTP